mmetsp:Transcript_17160/g.29814  ORF Transcript_17160/g.29814 Transcript_17160/m.29814 type:complete len:208 (+) Transcript_17160:107-730(+)
MGRPCLRSKLQRPSSFRWLQPLQEDLAGTAHFQEALVRIGIWRFVRVERRALLAVHGVHLLAILRDVALLKTEQGRSLLRIQRQLPTLGVENRNSFAVVLCVVLHPLLRTIHPIPLAEAISHSMLVVLNLGLDLPSFIVLPPMPSLPRFHCALILDKKTASPISSADSDRSASGSRKAAPRQSARPCGTHHQRRSASPQQCVHRHAE